MIMIISFIGMSGSGKSYWSKQLQKRGYKWFCCDDLIEQKLSEELNKLGYSGINDVAKWMGQPFDPQYKTASKKYLQLENEVIEEIFAFIENSSVKEDIIIDTTGSVIYAQKELLQTLTRLAKVIYFETPDSVKEEMYKLYLKDPKPVLWGSVFKKTKDEDAMKTLARCYPKLLSYRSNKYEKLAHIKLDYHTLCNPEFTVDLFLQAIQ